MDTNNLFFLLVQDFKSVDGEEVISWGWTPELRHLGQVPAVNVGSVMMGFSDLMQMNRANPTVRLPLYSP